MRISVMACHALELLLCLAEKGNSYPVSASELSDATGISTRFTLRIMRLLQQGGLVQSVRGIAGGYNLKIPPEQINLASIIHAVEDDFSVPEQKSGSTATTALAVWEQAVEKMKDSLSTITLKPLCDGDAENLSGSGNLVHSTQRTQREGNNHENTQKSSLGRQRCRKPEKAQRNPDKK